MSDLRRWWPLSGSDVARARASIAGAVDAWAADWVARTAPSLELVAVLIRPDTSREWTNPSGDVCIAVANRGWNRFVRSALDLPGGTGLPEDHRASGVIESLSGAMLSDLIDRVTRHVGAGRLAEQPRHSDGQSKQDISASFSTDDGEPLLQITVGDQWVRDTVGPTAEAPPRPAISRRAALDASLVTVEAIVGSCEMSALDFSDLAIGDVLVTGTALDAPLRLAIRGDVTHSSVVGDARPVHVDGRVALVIENIL